jgi:hypothetical protein
MLTVVCAYCGKFIRTVPGYGVSGISHGICEACEKIEYEKLAAHIAEKRGIPIEEARKMVEKYEAEEEHHSAPVIRTLGVKHARLMEKDGHPVKVLAFLWEDGSITSCAFDSKKSVECCHSEMNGGPDAYFAWIAHLSSKGYKEKSIEVENEVKKASILEEAARAATEAIR